MSMVLSGLTRRVAAVVLASLMIGCTESERNLEVADGGSAVLDTTRAGNGGPAPVEGAGAEGTVEDALNESEGREIGVLLFVGTSLTAGLGVPESSSYPLLIERRIESEGLPYRVVNAGISGETSTGARSRVDWLLRQPFDVLVLETGANDMLRGTDPQVVEENVQAIIDRVQERRPEARIVLAGMLAMPNLGPSYSQRFESLYPRIAQRNDLTLIPFLLEGVAAEPELNQADGIHPTPEGHRIIAENVWEVLEPVLREEAANVNQ